MSHPEDPAARPTQSSPDPGQGTADGPAADPAATSPFAKPTLEILRRNRSPFAHPLMDQLEGPGPVPPE